MNPEEPKSPADSGGGVFEHETRIDPGPTVFPTTADGQGTGDLVKEIAADLSGLVRKEVELARLEVKEILRDSVRALTLSGLAVALAVLLLPFVVLTLIEVLAVWLPRWSATLIVTGGMGVVAASAFVIARKVFKQRAQSKFVPERTMQSIKEDVEWAKSLKKP